jgi:SAM-dependent methyltransferase
VGEAELLSYCERILSAAEASATRTGDVTQALGHLRQLPIDELGALLLELPHAGYPELSKLLPPMPPDDVQESWAGASGYVLMRLTLNFARMVGYNYFLLSGRVLEQRRILDFGCGWGRIMRLMSYYSDPALIYGCDPWDRSIELCRNDRVLATLALSDYLPERLPFDGQRFDLIYSFSVFTHLSERAASMALSALTKAMHDHSVLVVTIRPVEYWDIHSATSAEEKDALRERHATRGFAYWPHNRDAIDGDVTYGDTSMSIEYLAQKVPGLRLRKVERTIDDPYQLVLFLTK